MTTIWAGLSVGAIYVLVALGYNIVFISAGTFNFANANLLMAGVFIAYWGLAQHGLPVLVVFLALQRYFQPGIATTGLKG